MAYPLPPKLLSCPQVSSFLHDSLTSLQKTRGGQATTLQTAMLVTPDGKLLTYESPLPVRTLRTYCSVAASLWAIHAASSPSTAVALDPAALHPSFQPGKRGIVPSELLSSLPRAATATSASLVITPPPAAVDGKYGDQLHHDGSLPVSIAAGFGGGAVFVVHRLQCGLFLACSTPSLRRSSSRPGTAGTGASRATDSSAVTPSTAAPATSLSASPARSSLLPQATLPQKTSPAPPPPGIETPSCAATAPDSDTPISPKTTVLIPHPLAAGAGEDNEREGHEQERQEVRVLNSGTLEGRDKASIKTMGASKKESVAATFALVRQQVDELAVQLDDQLGGLEVPTGNIGLNGFC